MIGGSSTSSTALDPSSGGRWPKWIALPVVLVVVVAGTALAVGYVVLHSPGLGIYYDNMTGIEWLDQHRDIVGVSHGVNVSQGQVFSTSVMLECPQLSIICNGTSHVSFVSATGLGNWPPNVLPCGMYRASFTVMSSDLPVTIPGNGSAIATLTLQAPDMSYPISQHANETFNYTGYLEVDLQIASA